MKYKYKVKLTGWDDEYLSYEDLDDVANLIGHIVEGKAEHPVGFVITANKVKEAE